MTLRLRNSLGGELEEFRPLVPGRVRMYHCGPTVKEAIHIGKFRSFLMADILRRTLELQGFEVHQVMNITDVGHLNEFEEDVIEIAAARSGIDTWELVESEERRFHEERKALRILDAHEYPRAREHIESMVEFIDDLEKKGVCYRAGGNLYLDTSRFAEFGKLTGKSREVLEELEQSLEGSAAPSKHHPLDIDLWRTDALHQMRWDSPWGRGFPGWHVECAAMSRKYLGGSFDIHTGADDNLFPHHECEIAQVELLTGKPLARYWLHTGPVKVEGKPMSRRNDNLVTVRELLEAGFRGEVVRLALLSSRYRDELDLDESAIDRARNAVNALVSFRDHLEEARSTGNGADRPAGPWIAATDERFREALEDDLDFPRALEAVLDALESLEAETLGPPGAALEALVRWDRVLGVL